MKMSNKFYLVLVVILFSMIFFSGLYGETSSEWKPSYYPKYTIKEFKEYAPAKEEIVFDNIDYPLLNAAVFYETNHMREKNNRKQLRHSQSLENAAQMHSEDMVNDNFFSHYNPYDSKKRQPDDRMKMHGVDTGNRGENIATAFGIQYKAGTSVSLISAIPHHTYISYAKDLVEGWMNSPGHRANILSKDYAYLGCGNYYFESDGGWPMFAATQNFGSIVPDDLYDSNTNNIDEDDQDNSSTVNSNSSNSDDEIVVPPFINVKYTYNKGYFMKTGDKSWIEKVDRKSYYYLEYAKDEVFYYLYDKSNNYYLALPISGGMAYYYNFKTESWVEFEEIEISPS
jgi:uncharacterized protein YkwD